MSIAFAYTRKEMFMGRAGRSGGGFKGGGSFGGGFGGRSGGSRGFGGRTSSSIGRNRGSTPSGGIGNSGILGGTSGRNNSRSTSRNSSRAPRQYIPVPYPSRGRTYSPYPSGRSRNNGGWGGGPHPSPNGGGYTPQKEGKSPKNPKESFRTALFFIIPAMIISILILIFNPGGKQEAPIPLESGAVIKTNYYTDELGCIHNSSVLEEGMEHFYERTGVQPYLYLTDNVNGQYSFTPTEVKTFLEHKYNELFQDEAHLLLLFTEHEGIY
ncbi:MAG: hypothetical protein GX958_06480, partial [Desulfitobacterium sp.]|nr:hypothetical protein [Desulfitobacterium sp.]